MNIHFIIALLFLATGWIGYFCGEREIAITAAIMCFLAVIVYFIHEKTPRK